MPWWAIVIIAAAITLPKAPGCFAYWHPWAGFRLQLRHWPRLTLGWWTWHFLPPSSARRLASVVEEIGAWAPRPRGHPRGGT